MNTKQDDWFREYVKTFGTPMFSVSRGHVYSADIHVSTMVKDRKECDCCHSAKQKWNSTSKMMEDCNKCNGKGVI